MEITRGTKVPTNETKVDPFEEFGELDVLNKQVIPKTQSAAEELASELEITAYRFIENFRREQSAAVKESLRAELIDSIKQELKEDEDFLDDIKTG